MGINLSRDGVAYLTFSRQPSATSLMLMAECFKHGAASRKIGYLILIAPL